MAAVREAKARIEGRQTAEAVAQEKVAAAELANKEAQAALQARIDQAEAAKTVAEQARAGLRTELDQMRRDSDAAIEKLKLDAAAKEPAIRAEARQVAEGAVQEKLASMEQAHKESEAALNTRIEQAEAAKTVAQGASTTLQTQLDQLRRDHEAAMEKMKQDAAARENAVRQESASQVEVAMQAKITQAEQAKAEAETKATAAEQRIRLLQETHDVQLVQRLQEQREALEQDKTNAVNAEKSTAFEEKMKLSSKVEELQRAIDKKTAEDLGEGAEVDLFEALKAEFDGDRIERINKGQPGADILHVVIHKRQGMREDYLRFQESQRLALRIRDQARHGQSGSQGRARDPIDPQVSPGHRTASHHQRRDIGEPRTGRRPRPDCATAPCAYPHTSPQ